VKEREKTTKTTQKDNEKEQEMQMKRDGMIIIK